MTRAFLQTLGRESKRQFVILSTWFSGFKQSLALFLFLWDRVTLCIFQRSFGAAANSGASTFYTAKISKFFHASGFLKEGHKRCQIWPLIELFCWTRGQGVRQALTDGSTQFSLSLRLCLHWCILARKCPLLRKNMPADYTGRAFLSK